jgi:hypothetical protein
MSKWEEQLKARNYDFVGKIDKFVIDTEKKMLTVTKIAIEEIVRDANDKNGKMRVDTGFLRSSGTSAINQIPKGESRGRERKKGEVGVLAEYAGYERKISQELQVTLARLKLGDTFNYGWTAYYAKYREAYDGFLESAVQKWQTIVDNAVKKVSGK